MRFGWLAAAATMVCAGSAGAQRTITQGFNSTYAIHDSTGSQPVGAIPIPAGEYLESVTINYTASADYEQMYVNYVGATATLSYSETAGFFIVGTDISAFQEFSGTTPCANGFCDGYGQFSGTLVVPGYDLSLFTGSTPLQSMRMVAVMDR